MLKKYQPKNRMIVEVQYAKYRVGYFYVEANDLQEAYRAAYAEECGSIGITYHEGEWTERQQDEIYKPGDDFFDHHVKMVDEDNKNAFHELDKWLEIHKDKDVYILEDRDNDGLVRTEIREHHFDGEVYVQKHPVKGTLLAFEVPTDTHLYRMSLVDTEATR